ncbi:hypothetical protein B296_00026702 [Ensete ventricosum]|uniref:Uncharacterized protein n=1 Tax=Ensete ventricosum TaxID=4639 RepID=A0A426Z0B5_ENSVE|nr:hypothetical protein B296_00026702 [Ensete ventricosum]
MHSSCCFVDIMTPHHGILRTPCVCKSIMSNWVMLISWDVHHQEASVLVVSVSIKKLLQDRVTLYACHVPKVFTLASPGHIGISIHTNYLRYQKWHRHPEPYQSPEISEAASTPRAIPAAQDPRSNANTPNRTSCLRFQKRCRHIELCQPFEISENHAA